MPYDVFGALWTLVTLLALASLGFACAIGILGAAALTDRLRFAMTSLLCTSAAGALVPLILGAGGVLDIRIGLPVLMLALGGASLWAKRRLSAVGVRPIHSARALAASTWRRLASFPVLSLVIAHAAGSEALRGLLRPPLSWDSLMYHLLLTGTWLQDHNITPVFGPHPTNAYGYVPANGSLWMWWWMAPSHSDLYVNLAFFPQCALLALAVGGVARELGAARFWPIAGFLTLLTPTVLRFAATEYVDIFLAAALVSACFFLLRWCHEAQMSDAALAGVALGLTAGTKVLGLPYVFGLALVALLLAQGNWRRRGPQVAIAVLLLAVFGSYFYLRNAAVGAGPLAVRCEGRPGAEPHVVPTLPRPDTVLADLGPMLRSGVMARTFLGISAASTQELGVGPQVLALLPVVVALPFFLGRQRRRAGLLVWSQILLQLAFWVAVPYANQGQIFANVRYLIGAIGLAFAGGIALLEPWASEGWVQLLAVALGLQDLLTLHAEMPEEVRWVIAVIDCLVVAVALSPDLRAMGRRRWRGLALAALVVVLALVPTWTHFRAADRTRAFLEEYTAHRTSANQFARAWSWLEHHAGDGTVATVSSPLNFFVYPAMGERLSRRAIYVNINRSNLRQAAAYPHCDPRVLPDRDAWLANLSASGVRWLMVSHFQPLGWPIESTWARALPDRFVRQYSDANAQIYAVMPAPASP
jgi:hypothetical protein